MVAASHIGNDLDSKPHHTEEPVILLLSMQSHMTAIYHL